MSNNCNDDVFVKVTNKDIYKKLCEVADHVKETNGKVKINRWVATTGLSLAVGIAIALIGMRVIG